MHKSREIKQALRNLSGHFSFQIMSHYFLIVSFLIVVIGFLFAHGIQDAQRDRQRTLLKEQSAYTVSLLNNRIQSVESDAISILSNRFIRDYLTYPYKSKASKINDALYSFQPMVRWVMEINSQYRRIHFLSSNQTTIGDPFVSSLDEYKNEDWVQNTMLSSTHGFWQALHAQHVFTVKDTAEREMLSTYTYYVASEKSLVMLDVSPSWLYQGIDVIVDCESGMVLFSELTAFDVESSVLLSEENSIVTVERDGKAYIAYCSKYDPLGIDILTCTEMSSIVLESKRMVNLFFFGSLLSVVVSLALLYISSCSAVVRMKQISSNVSSVTEGKYGIHYHGDKMDEIDQLGQDIVYMAHQMDEMVNQRLNQQMLLQEAEFRALQQQINPHFIFNILQTMQMMAEMNDQTDLADMITKFGSMVRYNLYAAQNVPLTEEIRNLHDYMDLQKILFNDQVEMQLEMDTSLTNLPEVPRLLLQPLVENAVLHGREPNKILHILVTGVFDTDGYHITVSNDGKKLSAEQERVLQELLLSVVEHPGTVDGNNARSNLALINIQKRLLIRFGANARLYFGSSEEYSVIVSFTIPLEDCE